MDGEHPNAHRFEAWHMNVNAAYHGHLPALKVPAARLSLPTVTLLCADCIHIEYSIPAIERCKAVGDFGAVKLLTSMPSDYPHRVEIGHLGSLDAYSVFMLTDAYKYVETEHALIVQHDGWVLNPEAWDPAWLQCDYIGPLFLHAHETGPRSVGSGGFSLRSRRLMERVAGLLPTWDGTPEDTSRLMRAATCYEDGVIASVHRDRLVEDGFLYGTPEQAAHFAQGGNNDPAYHVERPFGFHGLWSNIDHATGTVAPPPFLG